MNKSYQKSTQKNSIYITASLVIQFLFKKNLNLRYLCLAFGKIQHIWLKNQIQCTYIYILYCTVASAATVTSLVFLRRFRYFRDIVATGNCWIKHSSQSTFSHLAFQFEGVVLRTRYTTLTTRTHCRYSCWLRGHDNDYADTFGSLWRLLTDFKGTIRWKRYLGLFTHPIAIK